MDCYAKIKCMQALSSGIPVGKLVPDVIQNIFVSTDGLADNKTFRVFQRLVYLLATGYLANAGIADIIHEIDHITCKDCIVSIAQIEQHTVITRNGKTCISATTEV